MQRLIEQPTGEGDVLAAGVHLGRVHYHLSVYQHFSANEHDTVPPSLEVEGRLVPSMPRAVRICSSSGTPS